MNANNSTLLEILFEDGPLKPGEPINGEVVLTTIEPLKDAALNIDISATAVNEADFSLTADYTIQVNMAPGQQRHKIKIPVTLHKPAEQGPKKGTMRILVKASLESPGGHWLQKWWRRQEKQLDKTFDVKMR